MRNKKQLNKISQYLCLLLRHNPSSAGLQVDSEGWMEVSLLLNSFKKEPLLLSELEEIVNSDDKERYSFKDDKQFIRCNQGHSLPDVQITFKKYTPTGDLYHGTNPILKDVILKTGLNKQKRNFVHLSESIDTANSVGKRHSGSLEPLIFVVDKNSPLEFWISDNNVILVDFVDPCHLSVL